MERTTTEAALTCIRTGLLQTVVDLHEYLNKGERGELCYSQQLADSDLFSYPVVLRHREHSVVLQGLQLYRIWFLFPHRLHLICQYCNQVIHTEEDYNLNKGLVCSQGAAMLFSSGSFRQQGTRAEFDVSMSTKKYKVYSYIKNAFFLIIKF